MLDERDQKVVSPAEEITSRRWKSGVCPENSSRPGTRAGVGVRLGATPHGANSGQQLARPEWIRNVVVGAQIEADDAIGFLALGSQHDDRHRRDGVDSGAKIEARSMRSRTIRSIASAPPP